MSNQTFWTRISLASVLLNVPVAVGVVLVGVPLLAGLVASCALGIGVLGVVDGQRAARSKAVRDEPLMDLRVEGSASPVGAPARTFVGCST